MEKTTKRDILNYMLGEYANDKIVVDFATHELELLDRKNSNRANKNNDEDIVITDMIIKALTDMTTTDKRTFTITEILGHETLKDYVCESTGKALSNSKVTSLMRKELEKENARVVNVKDKKNSFYGLAD